MVKHTAGPWHADRAKSGARRDYHQIDVTGRNGLYGSGWPLTVADTSNRDRLVGDVEDAANARLIAAAPELVETLRELIEEITYWHPDDEGWQAESDSEHMWIRKARALLARIEGKE